MFPLASVEPGHLRDTFHLERPVRIERC